MDVEEMGKTLRFRRELPGLRQRDLSEITGVRSRTIFMIEHGRGNPSVKTLEKLAMALGMEFQLQVKKSIS